MFEFSKFFFPSNGIVKKTISQLFSMRKANLNFFGLKIPNFYILHRLMYVDDKKYYFCCSFTLESFKIEVYKAACVQKSENFLKFPQI